MYVKYNVEQLSRFHLTEFLDVGEVGAVYGTPSCVPASAAQGNCQLKKVHPEALNSLPLTTLSPRNGLIDAAEFPRRAGSPSLLRYPATPLQPNVHQHDLRCNSHDAGSD